MRIYIKYRNGRGYYYAQETIYVPGRKSPRTPTRYIGPVDGVRRQRKDPFALEPGEVAADEAMRKYSEELLAKDKEEKPELWSQAKFLEQTAGSEKSPASSGTSEANDVAGEPSVGQT
ncbi:hypothetical protein [Bradyrhizobium sp. UNPF46]|uniref:hypothetical protein n=1 Tax=Bradyrhizobium sp. UNPF46 TaxID=1141168 RepID=UPI00114E5763|nr:hypothetical protein [Bradyrhizobium sp. UNPF46]